MKLLFCAAEMAPLVKVGGLADVVGSLAKTLAGLGHDVRAVIPLYGCIDRDGKGVKPTDVGFDATVKGVDQRIQVWRAEAVGDVQVYLLEHEDCFGGQDVYTSFGADIDRFFCFSSAALELPRHIEWWPDVVHCHDWHTAAIVSRLRSDLQSESTYASIGSTFTIHNLAYQGWFDYHWAKAAGILHHIPPAWEPLHSRLWCMMGLGIYHADVVSTVSETYAREILSPEYGEGLDPVLRHRHANLYGITNGIDYTEFNPRAAPFLAKHYRLGSLGGKRKLKLALQSELGITSDPDIPLLAYIGRLTRQKGIWLLAEGVGKLLEAGKVQLAVLGKAPAGEESYEEMLCSLEVRYPQQVRLTTRYDEPLAHRIYAGADMFVMPSLYEPCGLTQLIALRYGTIPVVRHTGGLVDTVRENSVMGNGFVFHDTRNGADLERAIMRAIELYRQKEHWSRLVARAMCCDVSWERACHQYEEMYQRAIQMRRG